MLNSRFSLGTKILLTYAFPTGRWEREKYKNKTMVIVDSNGNLITDKNQLQTINEQFQAIQTIQDEKEKEKALKEFLENYNFVSQKDYVDTFISINNITYKNNKIFKKVG